uniref:FP protein C-terminal domain-containing protein n=1 Tax=Cacopsylla melanoneura TaxID=428564 RepID=A0A8D9B2D2_9HEMI
MGPNANEITQIIRTEMNAAETRLMEKMTNTMKSVMTEEIEKFKKVIDTQNEIIKKLEESNKKLEESNNLLTIRVNDLEQYSIRSNIQITNIPEQAQEDLEKMICELGEKVGVKLDFKQDIQAIHRVPTKSTRSPKPIIVKFSNRQLRNTFIKKAKEKKMKCSQMDSTKDLLFSGNNQIYLNDHLTPANNKIFYEARKCVKEKRAKSAWTRDGKIYVKRDDMSPPVQISSVEKLNAFRPYNAVI